MSRPSAWLGCSEPSRGQAHHETCAAARAVFELIEQRLGERHRIVIDGPASDHDLVLRGRLATQAPDIDAGVYLTECDPSAYRAGDFVEVEVDTELGHVRVTKYVGWAASDFYDAGVR